MKYITEEDTIKTENTVDGITTIHLDGFDQLIEASRNGEFAVWEYGEYIGTTDDVPDNIDELEYTQIIRHMKSQIFARYDRLEESKNKNQNKSHNTK